MQALRCHDRLFVDFIERCLRWDPDRRMRPHEALRHEWIKQAVPMTVSTSGTTHNRSKHHSTPKISSG